MSSLIDKVLERLHDDGTTFSRAEILGWLSEGYRRLTFNGKHIKTFTALDMPPRHASAITYDWERSTCDGTWRKWTHTSENGEYECSFLWEAQALAGAPVEDIEHVTVTHLWELAYAGDSVDTHYRFMLPKNDAHILEVWHDEQRLTSATAKGLDATEDKWWQIGGQPHVWSQSLSDDTTFDVWEIQTDYHESFTMTSERGAPRAWIEDDHTFNVTSDTVTWDYAYSFNGEALWGTPVPDGVGWRFTGYEDEEATYTFPFEMDETLEEPGVDYHSYSFPFESDDLEPLEIGVMRAATSQERQYFPSYQWSCQGVIRQASKSEDAILIYHRVVAPEQLQEEDNLDMLPPQMTKYLVYYALGVLLNRQGIGYDPALAGHYEIRAGRAVSILRNLGKITRIDDGFVRGGGQRGRREPSLPGLPSNFPRAPWLRR